MSMAWKKFISAVHPQESAYLMITLHPGLQSIVQSASAVDYQGVESARENLVEGGTDPVPQILLRIQLDEIGKALPPLSLGKLLIQTQCSVLYKWQHKSKKGKESGPTQKKVKIEIGVLSAITELISAMNFRGWNSLLSSVQ